MKGRRYKRISRALCATALGAGALCLVPVAAPATERVQDGGFEASICDADECTNPSWPDSTTAGFAVGTGPICRSGTGSGNTDCNGGGSVPFSGSTWARLGAGFHAVAMSGGVVSSLEQIYGQDTTTRLGKLLRINPSGTAPFQYSIPGTTRSTMASVRTRTRSTPTACATRGASPSTAPPAI